MKLTFGICTIEENKEQLERLIESILKQNIPEYEIIIVGSKPISNYEFNGNIKFVEFDESIKNGWITKKKNLITSRAKYNNIVYLHDYLLLDENWYLGLLKHGEDFQVLTNKLTRLNGERYLDWTLWEVTKTKYDFYTRVKRECLLDYNVNSLTKFMYISGAYFIAKKFVMEEFQLDEKLTWKNSEDVEWSLRVRNKYTFKFNPHSEVTLQIEKDNYPYIETSPHLITKLDSIKDKPFSLKIDKALYKIFWKRVIKYRNKNNSYPNEHMENEYMHW